MEEIFEMIAEIIFEVSLDLIKGKSPLWVKIPAIIIISLICAGIIGSIGFLGISCILEGNYIGGAIILTIAAIVIYMFVREVLKRKNND